MLLCLVLSVGVALPSIVVAVRSESVLLLSDVLDYVRAIVVSLLAWRILRAGRTAGAQGFDYGTGRLQTLGGVVGAVLYVGLLLVLAEPIAKMPLARSISIKKAQRALRP